MGWSKVQQDEYNKRYYVDNRDKIMKASTEYKSVYRFKNPHNYICAAARRRARMLGQEFDITWRDIIIPDKCPILGIPLFFTPGKNSANSPSLDRVNNDRGYTKDNIQVISYEANRMKSDHTIETLERVLEYIKNHNKEREDN